MLKKLTSEAYFTLRITTTGPLLIKTGHASISGPDMTPVLTFRNGQQEVFLPGSSLKGVFRSHLEKIICSLKQRVVCYPFSSDAQEADLAQRRRDYLDSCGARFVERTRDDKEKKRLEERTDLVYADCCPTCRLFGSFGFIGRVAIGDAYLVSKEIKELRDGVGIDRLTGGASHGAKFELEVVSTGVVFETDIHLRNFEVWQLGMLFVVLQDMEDELIRIGSGRSRGLGKVKGEISTEASLGRWLKQWSDEGGYGTWPDDQIELSLPGERSNHGIRRLRIFNGEALNTLRDATIDQFSRRMSDWPPPSVKGLNRVRGR